MESGAWSYWTAQPMDEAEQQFQGLKAVTKCSSVECLVNSSAKDVVELASHNVTKDGSYGCQYVSEEVTVVLCVGFCLLFPAWFFLLWVHVCSACIILLFQTITLFSLLF